MADKPSPAQIAADLEKQDACSFADAYKNADSVPAQFALMDEVRKQYEVRRQNNPALPAIDFEFHMGGTHSGRLMTPDSRFSAFSHIVINPGLFSINVPLFHASQDANSSKPSSMSAWKLESGAWKKCE
jgi:hypothetical protein